MSPRKTFEVPYFKYLNMKSFLIHAFLILLTISFAWAQDTTNAEVEASAPSNLLEDQFNDLKNNSNSYQEYKVIKLSALNSFWKIVKDSLKANDQELITARQNIISQNQQILVLKQDNALKEKEVQKSTYDIANISVLGVDMEKGKYVTINWFIIGGLLLLLGVVFYQYKESKKVSSEKRKAYEEIDLEYNDHKQKSREKELKIKRELQTEMNRVEELNQQIAALRKQAHM